MNINFSIVNIPTRILTTHRFRAPEKNQLLSTLAAACVATAVLLIGNNRLAASEDPTEVRSHNETDVGSCLAQNAHSTQADQTPQPRRSASPRPKVNVDQNDVIIKGYDPVAYFVQKKPVKGSPDNSSRYGGAIYYFASPEDKAEFDKDPAKYAPQYGGFCAENMTRRRLADIDPNCFIIYEGKLYVCENVGDVGEFNSNPAKQTQRADANWKLYYAAPNPAFNRNLGN